ncbi:MAG TPA: hypothetical protein VGZ73_03035 [Bryobacteraceae bacterium]|jgi:hypothetical protein|nr:hypothetical protein [Bryobacteraceae bacterium]
MLTLKTRWAFGAVTLLMAALSGFSGYAQPGRRLEFPTNRSLVVVIHVKPEMLGEWLDLQKRAVVPTLKKAGVTSRTVYSSHVFGTAFEYRIVQPLNRFADFDSAELQTEGIGAAGDEKSAAQLRKCISRASSFLATALPELSNPSDNKAPAIVQCLRLHVAPGKMEEYQDLYKSEVVPALKKARAYVSVASRRLGTDGLDLTFETPLNKFAELDAPPALLRSLGPEGAARLTAKLNSLATVVENTIWVRENELSF